MQDGTHALDWHLVDASAVVPRHLDCCAARNLRPGTIKQRKGLLRRLCRFTEGRVLEATSDDLSAFLAQPGRGASARGTDLSHIRSFYRWALVEEQITVDPTVRLEGPKLPRRLPRPMPDDDVARAFDEAPLPRIRPALYLAAYAGLRACEISGLSTEDLRWEAQPAFIFLREQKGGGEGVVPLSDQLAEGLHA
jgi:site-specific recombinase XerD